MKVADLPRTPDDRLDYDAFTPEQAAYVQGLKNTMPLEDGILVVGEMSHEHKWLLAMSMARPIRRSANHAEA